MCPHLSRACVFLVFALVCAACSSEPSVYIFSDEMCSANQPDDVVSHTRSLEIRVHCHKQGYWDACDAFSQADFEEIENRQEDDSGWHEKNWTYSEAEVAAIERQCDWSIAGQDADMDSDMSTSLDMSPDQTDMMERSDAMPPAQPRVTAVGIKDGVRLEWAPVEGATSYQVKRLDWATWEDVGAETSWLDETTDSVTVEELVFEAGDATHRDHVELTATYNSTPPVYFSYQVRALNKDVAGPESSRIEAARSHPLYHEFEAQDEEGMWQTIATEDEPSFLHTDAPGKGNYVDYRMRVVDADGVPFGEYEISAGRGLAVVDIDVGLGFTCAILNDGSVWCWGSQRYQPIGGGGGEALDPIQMDFGPDADVRSLHLGAYFGCALVGDRNSVWCWGQVPAQLSEISGRRLMPEETQADARHFAFSGFTNFCFIGLNYIAYCTGPNNYGQLGLGHTEIVDEPEGLAVPESRSVSFGFEHGCVVDSMGRVKCWGRNTMGQVGPSLESGMIYSPQEVELGSGVVVSKVTAAFGFSCALTEGGAVWCWGQNTEGQLGNGTTDAQDVAVQVVFPVVDKMVDLIHGMGHTCAVSELGDRFCWGNNQYGQLGDNTQTHRPLPVKLVDSAEHFVKLRLFVHHSCAVTDDGGAMCWGSNGSGALGTGLDEEELPESPTPVSVRINGFTF